MCTCDYRINNDYSRAVNHCIQVVSKPRAQERNEIEHRARLPFVIVVSFGAACGTLWCIRGPTAHFRSLWRLSHSCGARRPEYLPPSPLSLLFNGTMSKWGSRSEALTFVFYSAFIRMWQPRVAQVGLTFTRFFQAVSGETRQESSRVCHAFRSLLCVTYQNSLNHRGSTSKCELTESDALKFLTLQNG